MKGMAMRTELVRIGNSRGIRIPKLIIEQCGFGEKVELRVENHRLIVSPQRAPRQGWEEIFRAAGPATEDKLLLEDAGANEFDHKEWKW
jgi:antitoxin MazE